MTTEVPYFVDEGLNVSRVSDGACTPLLGAQVDVWHCDAVGVYSDVIDPGFNTVGQR